MNDNEMRIAIAKACGWQKVGVLGGLVLGWPSGCPFDYPHREVPDYLNDLNAMHEAEKVLRWNGKRDLTVEYTRCLYNIIDRESGEQFSEHVTDPLEISSVLLRATARQRAEAYVRILGHKL